MMRSAIRSRSIRRSMPIKREREGYLYAHFNNFYLSFFIIFCVRQYSSADRSWSRFGATQRLLKVINFESFPRFGGGLNLPPYIEYSPVHLKLQ